jgi:sRNA-binding protein
VNIPVAVKVKPQMVIEYQLRKKQLEEEQARYEAEKKIQEQKALEEERRAEEAGVAPEPIED